MGKYDYIKNGNLLYWNDPDNSKSDGEYKVISAPEEVDSDSIILISSGAPETEVFASELSPIPTPRSHKEEFQKWRAEGEAEGREFFNRLSEVEETRENFQLIVCQLILI